MSEAEGHVLPPLPSVADYEMRVRKAIEASPELQHMMAQLAQCTAPLMDPLPHVRRAELAVWNVYDATNLVPRHIDSELFYTPIVPLLTLESSSLECAQNENSGNIN